uniref:Uncharacterized protein n=1 Tax=Rhizophora mucronata TaxID=61149 RepID=A0A2P2QJZ7_RHIMU
MCPSYISSFFSMQNSVAICI